MKLSLHRLLPAWSAALAGAVLAAPAAAPVPSPSPLPVVAPGDCWLASEGGAGATLPDMLQRCLNLGARAVRLQVRATPAGGAVEDAPWVCASPAQCLPLPRALALGTEGDRRLSLLLETPVEQLDALQRTVDRLAAASRVWVEPRFQHPQGALDLTIAPGVRYRREPRQLPRPVMLHMLEIDLAAAHVEFVATPPTRTGAGGQAEYAAEPTSAFARRQGLLAAVNATYFRPFASGRLMHEAYVPQPGSLVTVSEVKPADERVDAPWVGIDSRVDGGLCVGPEGVMPSRIRCLPGSLLALAGGPMLLEGGRRAVFRARSAQEQPDANGVPRYYREPQPRTAVAADPAGRKAWLVVVDGRQGGYSEGLTLAELTDVLTTLGATDAINLDGGGSSTLAVAIDGETRVVNSPIHTSIPGRERPVANHFGLRLVPR